MHNSERSFSNSSRAVFYMLHNIRTHAAELEAKRVGPNGGERERKSLKRNGGGELKL